MLGPKRKYFQTPTDIISSEQLRKLEKIKPFGHSKAPKKEKIMTDFANFLRPGENYPYVIMSRARKTVSRCAMEDLWSKTMT